LHCPGWLSGRNSAELTASATRGVDALDPYFARYLPQLVLAVLVPPLVIIRIGVADAVSGAIVLVTLPLIPLFMVLIGWSTQRLMRRQWRSLERLSHHFLDIVEGLPTLRVFGRAKAAAAAVEGVTDDYRRATMKVLRVSFLSALVLELTATLSVALVAVGVGLRVVDATVALETALIVLILAPEAYLPLRQVGVHYHAATEGMAAAERVFEMLETPVHPAGTAAVNLRAAVLDGRDLRVRYGDAAPLPPLDFELHPGEFVAISGPSGCGKSSLLQVLLCFVEPSAGQVRAGGAGLVDLDATAWRRQIAWLPERPNLLCGTVADNVRLGLPDLADDDVRLALRRAAAAEIAPGRAVGEGGQGLSGGQRQRVALARTFARMQALDAPLLLLDEPTAHLDAPSATQIATVLRELAGQRTILAVTHSEAMAAAADRVITLDPVRVAV
jgi:thiol reductant ABC exporter CydD subunit